PPGNPFLNDKCRCVVIDVYREIDRLLVKPTALIATGKPHAGQTGTRILAVIEDALCLSTEPVTIAIVRSHYHCSPADHDVGEYVAQQVKRTTSVPYVLGVPDMPTKKSL